ncbi:hypothetical protein FRB99_006275, partial [Tulasnella sp. 403]
DSFIASGGFGSVHQAVMDKRLGRSGSGTRVAVKKLHFSGDDNFIDKANALAREVSVWAPLEHPNIVAFVGFCVNMKNKEAWLVSHFAENGTVLSFINNQNLDLEGRLGLVKDTIVALSYMHTRDPPICHGDIKPINVLVNSLGRAMLCDFGLANAVGATATGYTTSGFKRAGTLRYQSPELLLPDAVRSLESDVWAWGCLVLKMSCHVEELLRANGWYVMRDRLPADLADRYTWAAAEAPDVTKNIQWSRETDLDSLERKLRVVLASVTHHFIKRSRLTFTRAGTNVAFGASTTVHRATLDKRFLTTTPSAVVVAVKKSRRAHVGKENRYKIVIALLRELIIWADLRHPNIVPFLGFYLSVDYKEAWLVSPFASNGNVVQYLAKRNPDFRGRLELMRGSARGLEYLHNRVPPVCHGNIKGPKILVDDSGRAMLCGFGLARSTDALQTALATTGFNMNVTVRWGSPELFTPGVKKTTESDVWAFGCLCFEILTGLIPYNDVKFEAAVVLQVIQGTLPAELETLDCPEPVRELLRECWRMEPSERPKMNDIVAILSDPSLHIDQ